MIRLPDGRGQCLACGKVLSNYNHARRHFTLVHEPKAAGAPRHDCHVCGWSTGQEIYLKDHLRKMHNIYQSMVNKAQMM